MGCGTRSSRTRRFVWIMAISLAGLLTTWTLLTMPQVEREAKVLGSMPFPIVLSASSVRAAYPEVRTLALTIRPDFVLTHVVYSPGSRSADYWFKAYGRWYQSEIVALGLYIDTLAWQVSRGEIIYGSRQIDFRESDLDLTPLDVMDVLAIAVAAGGHPVTPGKPQPRVSVHWQAGHWLVWYPDSGIRVYISTQGEVEHFQGP